MKQYDVNWIWIPGWEKQDDFTPQFLYFRKEFKIEGIPNTCSVKISADSRYKLYVNGTFLQEGPSKGNEETWFYDQAFLTPYLREGVNVLAVIVLRYPEDLNYRNHSILRSDMPCLYVEGEYISSKEDYKVDLSGKSGWKCLRMDNIKLVAENTRPAPLHILENSQGLVITNGWMNSDYSDSAWMEAKPYSFFELNRLVSPGNITQRNIPYQRHIDRMFKDVICIRETQRTGDAKLEWMKMLTNKSYLVIPPNTKEVVEISAGELMTGYLKFKFAGGKHADIVINSAECYAYPPKENSKTKVPLKGDRTDYINGNLYGHEDNYKVGGYGTMKQPELYEPFWFRTFRFIGITIETFNEPLIITELNYTETGYPLDILTNVKTSDSEIEKIWDISQRTLRRCMHETYMDCPFYEQLQYAMDSRSEILFTYAVSADDRLARKCMEDFQQTQRQDGMICCSAPSARPNVIPGFSVFYILMVYDHMMYFGDKSLVKKHLPTIDRILNFFDQHLSSQGLVEGVGGAYMRHPYWSFIDWTSEWDETTGVPSAIQKGPITMESMLYIMGLQHAAELADYVGRSCIAQEYRNRAEMVRTSVRNTCIDTTGLIQDGPGVSEYSVHCQVFGVLTDVVSTESGKEILTRTINNENYAQCSVAMSYYLFRAMEKVDLYEKTYQLWEPWREMLRNNMTTCVENSTDGRSDCHAWGAVMLYELPSVILGVKPASPGFEKVRITSHGGYLEHASGDVITPRGVIHAEWKKEKDGRHSFSYTLPEGVYLVE